MATRDCKEWEGQRSGVGKGQFDVSIEGLGTASLTFLTEPEGQSCVFAFCAGLCCLVPRTLSKNVTPSKNLPSHFL
jgi:hypothetical protein